MHSCCTNEYFYLRMSGDETEHKSFYWSQISATLLNSTKKALLHGLTTTTILCITALIFPSTEGALRPSLLRIEPSNRKFKAKHRQVVIYWVLEISYDFKYRPNKSNSSFAKRSNFNRKGGKLHLIYSSLYWQYSILILSCCLRPVVLNSRDEKEGYS